MSMTFAVVRWVRGPFVRHRLEQRLRELRAERKALIETVDEYANRQWTMNWAQAKLDLVIIAEQIEQVEEEKARW